MGRPAAISIRETLPAFKARLEIRRLSPNTVEGYTGVVRRFADMCDQNNGGREFLVRNITADETTEFFSGMNAATSNRSLAAIRTWFRWCLRQRYLSKAALEAAIEDLGRVKEVRRPKLYLPEEDFPRMLEIAGEWHPRNRMMLALALYTLARQSEIAPLQLRDVRFDAGMVRLFRSKTKRFTDFSLCEELWQELELWLAWYAEDQGFGTVQELMEAHPDWYLVPRMQCRGKLLLMIPTQRLTSGLELNVKNVLDRMGYKGENGATVLLKGEGMHTLRRSVARALFLRLVAEKHEDALLTVQILLDHDTPEVTLRYIGMDLQKARVQGWLKGRRLFGDKPAAQEEDGNVIRVAFGQQGGRRRAAMLQS